MEHLAAKRKKLLALFNQHINDPKLAPLLWDEYERIVDEMRKHDTSRN